jgi:hypothetical protein
MLQVPEKFISAKYKKPNLYGLNFIVTSSEPVPQSGNSNLKPPPLKIKNILPDKKASG